MRSACSSKPTRLMREVVDRSPSAVARRSRSWFAIAGAGIALAAAAALFNRATSRRVEAETPPDGTFVEVDGVRVHYVDRGHGPTVVLLHGDGMLLQDFEASGVLAVAAERYRVLAFDRPGFGYSTRPRTTLWTPSAQATPQGS